MRRDNLRFLALGLLAALSLACSSLTISMDQPTSATRIVLVTRIVPVPANPPDSRYAFIDESMTWTQAKAYCEKQSAHLATITSEEEQGVVTALLLSSGAKKVYWVGGTKENGQWKWITDESFSYTHWASGEPTGWDGESVLSIIGKNNGSLPNPGFWDDCYHEGYTGEFALINYGLVCEWER